MARALMAVLVLVLAMPAVAQDPSPPAAQPDAGQPDEPPAPPTLDELLAALTEEAPATWRPAAEHLVARGETAIPALLAHLDGDDRRLAIRAGSVLRRMGLVAVAALRDTGRTVLASEIVRDRVRVMLTAPGVTPELPAEAPDAPDASSLTFELARGNGTERYELLEVFRFRAVDADTVRVIGVRYLSTPVATTGDPLPGDAAQVVVRHGEMRARHLAVLAEVLALIREAKLHGAGPRKGSSGTGSGGGRGPIGPQFGPTAVDDTLVPVRFMQVRLSAGDGNDDGDDAARYRARWAGGVEFTHPDFIRSMAALRTLSAFPVELAEGEPADLTDGDRAWFSAWLARFHRSVSREPLFAWIFARGLALAGHAGDRAALDTLRMVLADDTTPRTTRVLAIHAALRLLAPETDPRPDPFAADQLDTVSDAVLELLRAATDDDGSGSNDDE